MTTKLRGAVSLLILAGLLMMAVPSTAAVTMTDAQIEQLIDQIIASELDYQVIKHRAENLTAIANRTPAQEAELQSYLAKLAHDQQVITAWALYLKQNGGIQNLNKAEKFLTERPYILEEQRVRIQGEIDVYDQQWAEYLIWHEQWRIDIEQQIQLNPDLTQEQIDQMWFVWQENWDNSLLDYTRQRGERVICLDILAHDLSDKTIWSF